jgi:ankyrin repeat protein
MSPVAADRHVTRAMSALCAGLAALVLCAPSSAQDAGQAASPTKPAVPSTAGTLSTKNAPTQQKGAGSPSLSPNAAQTANVRQSLSATAPPAPQVSNEVPIVFEPSVLELGEMQADVPKAGVVKLRNVSSAPVKVLKAIPGCGCTTVGAPQEPIQPGEAAEIEITMKPGPKPGVNMRKSVTFQLEGYSPIVLTVQGNVAAYVTIEPDVIAAPKGGETTDQKIVMRSVDGQSFSIKGANPPILATIPADAALEHTLDIDWGKWEAQGRAMKLSVDTTHPKAPSLSVMIKRPLVVEPAGKGPTAPSAPAARPASEMVTASQRGDAARVRELLAAGGNANDVDPDTGRSALHFAARENRAEVVAILLDSKADINAVDRTGKTPLTMAAENSAVDATKLLIERGADLNKRDQIGGTPITWACGLGTAPTVKLLIDSGADLSVVDINGLTPLIWAAGIGKPESVKLLLERKPDLAVQDGVTGDTALMRAVRSGKTESVKLLIDAGADVGVKNRQGFTPVQMAAMSGNLEKVKLLVDAKADLASTDANGRTPLDLANRRADASGKEIAAYLQSVGAPSAAPPPGAAATAPAAPAGKPS